MGARSAFSSGMLDVHQNTQINRTKDEQGEQSDKEVTKGTKGTLPFLFDCPGSLSGLSFRGDFMIVVALL